MSAQRDECVRRDAADPLSSLREEFVLPDGVIYLAGNSLGALPRSVPGRVGDVLEKEWGQGLVGSWNAAGWWEAPRRIGARVASLVGAEPAEVVVGDGTSANLFKAVVAGMRLRPDRRAVVGERGNFPTDLYITDGASELLGVEHRRVDPTVEGITSALAEGDVGAVLLSHVDYRTGTLRDMRALTALVQEHDAVMIWDLCHSVGAVPLELSRCNVDFAVGCTYKYLNAGPGAPAFTYVATRHHGTARQPLTGWHGHAAPFSAADAYHPAPGASAFLSGSQPIVADAALEASLEVWEQVDQSALRAKSLALTDIFIEGARAAGFEVLTPLDHAHRGSQVALRHPHAYPIVRALAARGIVGDFREPDVLRFGFAALYLRHVDAYDAASVLGEVVRSEEWREERFQARSTVT
ncbi:kynureninase [Spiractinospora alimapuensis]|uniref:kynureninase n=1 Tax=Spiractinospora alimapuensis TaxID=2820884 RepID=UPI001F31742B|nr:kynureninase [Spiractinospora alimapuensis]QVQ52023.1 kynureninase [Spiractinospora alimapuensis]